MKQECPRVVATIATTLLTAQAQAQVASLLDPGTTLADISTWADDIRPSRPNTGPWHYVNIPRHAADCNAQRDYAPGCVVSAIERSLHLSQDAAWGHTVRPGAPASALGEGPGAGAGLRSSAPPGRQGLGPETPRAVVSGSAIAPGRSLWSLLPPILRPVGGRTERREAIRPRDPPQRPDPTSIPTECALRRRNLKGQRW